MQPPKGTTLRLPFTCGRADVRLQQRLTRANGDRLALIAAVCCFCDAPMPACLPFLSLNDHCVDRSNSQCMVRWLLRWPAWRWRVSSGLRYAGWITSRQIHPLISVSACSSWIFVVSCDCERWLDAMGVYCLLTKATGCFFCTWSFPEVYYIPVYGKHKSGYMLKRSKMMLLSVWT